MPKGDPCHEGLCQEAQSLVTKQNACVTDVWSEVKPVYSQGCGRMDVLLHERVLLVEAVLMLYSAVSLIDCE